MIASARRIVFVKGDIIDPVQPVSNLPMLTGSHQEVRGISWCTADVVDRFLNRWWSRIPERWTTPTNASSSHLAQS
jgi:hypothetical protein